MAQARQRVTVVLRGDVHLVELDPTRGSEIKKTRPAVIIQNDIDNHYSPITIIAPITSKFDSKLYPTEVLVKPPEGGRRNESVVLLNQLRALDKSRLGRRLGALTPATMALINDGLAIVLWLIDI
jgi:mRNA interferase MazF